VIGLWIRFRTTSATSFGDVVSEGGRLGGLGEVDGDGHVRVSGESFSRIEVLIYSSA
jgi:hypothetical protein